MKLTDAQILQRIGIMLARDEQNVARVAARPAFCAPERAVGSGPAALPAWKYVRADGEVCICAWCQKELGVPSLPDESHSICPRHRAEFDAVILKAKAERMAA